MSARCPLPIYPQYCHAQSPTAHKWVKLTAADVVALRQLAGFDASLQISFYLNHPIRYVYLCGSIVSVDFYPRFVILGLDDSSGTTIDVKVERVLPPRPPASGDGDGGAGAVVAGLVALDATETNLANVRVTRSCSDSKCALQHLTIGGVVVGSGSTIKAKGTIEHFRGQPQLKLLQTAVVQSTAEELRIWRDYALFATEVLCKPWVLARDTVEELERQDRTRLERRRDKDVAAARRRKEVEEHHRAQKKRWEGIVQRDLGKRARARHDEEREMDGNALDRAKPSVSMVGE